MNDFADLLRHQIATDLRAAPQRIRGRFSGAERAVRAGTIGELRAAARGRLPRAVFDYVDGAACDEVTAARNVAGLRAIELLPHALVDVSKIELATTVLGEPVALPLLGAPMGLTGLMHPDAEVALARALHDAGSLYVVGAMSSRPLEEVLAAARGPAWFQVYIWRDRGMVADLMRRARQAGIRALVVTVDVPCSGGRDRDRRNGFSVPPRISMRTLADGALHPAWSYAFLKEPRISWGNLPNDGGAGPASLSAQTNRQFDPSATWDVLEWFRDRWDGPLVVKGVLTPADARQAVSLGAQAVIVSNHGGRQLDGVPAAIQALPGVVEAVGADAEVYVDGGVRRGTDLVKALALGARACLAGRALAYGLGAAGQAGVGRAIEILRDELRTALSLIGCPSVHELDGSWVRLPR